MAFTGRYVKLLNKMRHLCDVPKSTPDSRFSKFSKLFMSKITVEIHTLYKNQANACEAIQ